MLTAHSLSKSFGPELILHNISFSLNPGERLGLVGPNGSGKTTLLRLLARLDVPDSGGVQWSPPDLRVGYLPQGFVVAPDATLADFLIGAEGGLPALATSLERAAEALVHSPDQAEAQSVYDSTLAQLTRASNLAERAPGFLAALGLAHLPTDMPVAALSGGQKTRLTLARVLVIDPQLLLLDEPTNHLDIQMLEWLEGWLGSFRGAALIVSHDRAFLDATVTRILELNPVTHSTTEYTGNYSDYVQEKLLERERQWQAFSDQQEEIVALKNAARHLRGLAKFKKGGKADSGDKFARGFFANRGLGTMGRAKHLEQRLEKLLTEEKIDKPRQTWQMKLDFGETPASGQAVLVTEDLAVGYGDTVLLRELNLYLKRGARTALIGPNGAGKTTLLRTIAGRAPPIAGQLRLGANVRLGYMAQEQELLDPALNALTTILRETSFSETEARTFLHYFLFGDEDVFVPVSSLSFGERARLTLACLVARGSNFLLLDEPINHLDIPSRARFEEALTAFEGTTLAVVHDRYFIERFATEVWEVADGTIRREEM